MQTVTSWVKAFGKEPEPDVSSRFLDLFLQLTLLQHTNHADKYKWSNIADRISFTCHHTIPCIASDLSDEAQGFANAGSPEDKATLWCVPFIKVHFTTQRHLLSSKKCKMPRSTHEIDDGGATFGTITMSSSKKKVSCYHSTCVLGS